MSLPDPSARLSPTLWRRNFVRFRIRLGDLQACDDGVYGRRVWAVWERDVPNEAPRYCGHFRTATEADAYITAQLWQ